MKGSMTGMDGIQEKPAYELLPKGTYTFFVKEKSDSESKNGDPMIKIVLEVAEGPKAGQKVWDNIILSANPESPGWNIRWRAKMFLKSIGQAHHGDSFPWDSDQWLNEKCYGVVEHEKQTQGKYAGELKAVIKQYLPLTAEPAAVQAAEEADKDIPF